MPNLFVSVPKYCRHKASGQAYVQFGGREVYLGVYGSEQSQAEYRRLIAEYLARQNTTTSAAAITVNELIDAFWTWAKDYYVKDGQPTGEIQALTYALRPVAQLYGHKTVTEFGPAALRTVREQLIKKGYCRPLINRYVNRIRRLFRWGVGREIVPPEVLQKLVAVDPLKKGRTPASEPEPVKAVADADIDAVLPHVMPQVGAMIRLQRLTGMRPGEVVIMRGGDIDRSNERWGYRSRHHKTEHHGRARVIALGPQARQILAPWLKADRDALLFSPREAMQAMQQEKRLKRIRAIFVPIRCPSSSLQAHQTWPRPIEPSPICVNIPVTNRSFLMSDSRPPTEPARPPTECNGTMAHSPRHRLH